MEGRPPIAAFVGGKGVGKSLAAEAMLAAGYLLHPLGGALKRALVAIGVEPSYLHDPSLKETPLDILGGRTARYAMQTLGTDWGRAYFGADFWLGVWDRTRPKGPVVVDDVRFVNEAAFLRARGARIYRVVRTEAAKDGHASEAEHQRIEVDGVVVNDGLSPSELGAYVRGLVQRGARARR